MRIKNVGDVFWDTVYIACNCAIDTLQYLFQSDKVFTSFPIMFVCLAM